jgi:hypothetical protein
MVGSGVGGERGRKDVVGYDLWVDKFIGNVEKCTEGEQREKEREHVSQ